MNPRPEKQSRTKVKFKRRKRPSGRGRRYTRVLRRDKRQLEKRLANARAALERIVNEKQLTRARDTAAAALEFEAAHVARERE